MHNRARASIGDANSLFGASDGNEDFLTQLAPANHPHHSPAISSQSTGPQYSNTPQHQQYGQQYEAVGEVEGGENDARHRQFENGEGGSYGQGGYSTQSSQYDTNHYDDQAYESNPPTDYQSHEQNGDYSNVAAGNEGEYVEPPYYPGYIYDYASNSYLEDLNYQPDEQHWPAEENHQQQEHGNYEDNLDVQGNLVEGQGQQGSWSYQDDGNQGESYDQSRDTTNTEFGNQSWEQQSGVAGNEQSWETSQPLYQEDAEPSYVGGEGQSNGYRDQNDAPYDHYSEQAQPEMIDSASRHSYSDPAPQQQPQLLQHQQPRQPKYDQSYNSSYDQQFTQPANDLYDQYSQDQQATQTYESDSQSYFDPTPTAASFSSSFSSAQPPPITSYQQSFSPPSTTISSLQQMVSPPPPAQHQLPPIELSHPISAPTPPPRNFATRPPAGASNLISPRMTATTVIHSSPLAARSYSPQLPTTSITQALFDPSSDTAAIISPADHSQFTAPELSITQSSLMNQQQEPEERQYRSLPSHATSADVHLAPRENPQREITPSIVHHHHNLSNIAEGYEASSVGDPYLSRRPSLDARSNDGGEVYSDYGDSNRAGEAPFDAARNPAEDMTSAEYQNHDESEGLQAASILPPPRAAVPERIASSPVSASVDRLVAALASSTLEPGPVVKLRRRSFGKRESPTSPPPARQAAAAMSLTGIVESDQLDKGARDLVTPEVNIEAPSPADRSLPMKDTWKDQMNAMDELIEGQQGDDGYVPNSQRNEADRTVVDLDLDEDDSILRDTPDQSEKVVYNNDYSDHQDQYSQQNYEQQQPPQEFEYGLDGSSVFDNVGGMSNGLQTSEYGEWNGNHEAAGDGSLYNYVNESNIVSDGQHHQQASNTDDFYSQQLPHTSKPPPSHSTPYQQHQQQQIPPPSTYDPYAAPPLSSRPHPSIETSPSHIDQRSLPATQTIQDPYTYNPPPAQPSILTDDSYSAYPSNPAAPPGPSQQGSYSTLPAIAEPLDEIDPTLLDPYAATRRYDHYAGYATEANSPVGTSFGDQSADLKLSSSSAPVIRFGFGGRMIIVFPQSPAPAPYSQYGAVTAIQTSAPSSPSIVHIRKLAEIIPEIEMNFPGPIFMDGGKANAGKKKKESITWLDQWIASLEDGISYIGTDVSEEMKANADSKIILSKLVKVLMENDGILTGSAKVDEAVRSILSPPSLDENLTHNGPLPLASELSLPASQYHASNGSLSTTVAEYSVTSSNIDKISNLLSQGDREAALRYALDFKMWAHAFIISSRIGDQSLKEVTTEFVRSELAPPFDGTSSTPSVDGRQALRVAYSLFSGCGADAMSQFLPTRSLNFRPILPPSAVSTNRSLRATGAISRVPSPAPTLIDTSFPTDLPTTTLSKWRETAAIIVANRMSGDSAALTRLGDTLVANGWFEAAHVCYLLSPATSPIGGAGGISTRIVLVGAEAPTSTNAAAVGLESIMLTELVEFAFSLTPVVKGQEVFAGFPHLQAFKLYHANQLVDAGLISQAQKYTDAIVGTLKLATHSSPFYHSGLVAQVKALSERALAVPGKDKSSWITRNVPRPTVDSLWSTLEGRFSKFVAGEGEAGSQDIIVKPETISANVGPFSHFSAISPAISTNLSRRQSQNELNSLGQPPVSPSSFSPIQTHPASQSYQQQSTAAIVNSASPPSSQPPISSRGPTFARTHHARSSSLGFAGYNYDPAAPPPWQSYTPPSPIGRPPLNESRSGTDVNQPYDQQEDQPFSASSTTLINEYEQNPTYDDHSEVNSRGQSMEAEREDVSWSNAVVGESVEADNSTTTLRAPVFSAVEAGSFTEDASGFISPMGAFSPVPSPGPPSSYSPLNPHVTSHQRNSTRAELDDLGIGNSRSKKPGFDSINEQGDEGEETSGNASPVVQKKPEMDSRPQIKSSRSWLGGWFKREPGASQQPAGPGPVKANLGEQTSFVYDDVSKRWVNKKTGGEIETGGPLTKVPPPRAATASPSRSRAAYGNGTPPPPLPDNAHLHSSLGARPPPMLNRSATSADLGEANRLSAGEFRATSTGVVGPPRSGTMSPPPPMNLRSGSSTPVGGAKRKVKSKYVVV